MTPILWLCGPPGVGKSTAAWEIYSLLVDRGIDSAYVDIDQLGICCPALRSDLERCRVKARNLRALVRNFKDAGARATVVSGVEGPVGGSLEGSDLEAALMVVRLRANDDELAQRLGLRRGSSVRVKDALRIAEQMDSTEVADVVVDTSGLTPEQVVNQALERIGDWPPPNITAVPPTEAPAAPVELAGGPILWLCGPTGVGKSTAGFSAYLAVARRGLGVGYVDMDQIGFCSGAELDHRLRARNLASVWTTYRSVGARAGGGRARP